MSVGAFTRKVHNPIGLTFAKIAVWDLNEDANIHMKGARKSITTAASTTHRAAPQVRLNLPRLTPATL
jgi:hypothetical protein